MNTMADGAAQRLVEQIGEALFGQPGMTLMELAEKVKEMKPSPAGQGEVRIPLPAPGNGEWSVGWNACREAMLRGEGEALAARQPVEPSVEEDVYCAIADMIEPYVQREGTNPDGELPASVHDSVAILLEHWLRTRQPVGYSGVRTCGDERPCINCYSDQGDCLGPAPSQDPTHQPVLQEPMAWISRIRCVGPEYGKEIYGKLPVQSLNPLYYEHIPLYAAPAQAVDLEQFRPAVCALGLYAEEPEDVDEAKRLLALIDSQAAGK